MFEETLLIFSCFVFFSGANGHPEGVHNHQVTLSCDGGTQEHRVRPGPPGKQGPAGPAGPQGTKGDPGSCTESCSGIEERLTFLEKQSTSFYKSKLFA